MTKAERIHVAPAGDDSGPGTARRPLRTIPAALAEARARLDVTSGGVEVRLGGGTYHLARRITVGPALSGLRLCAEEGQTASLTGMLDLHCARPAPDADLPVAAETRGRLWQVDLPPGIVPQALYVNGRRRARARWPKHDRWEEWPQCTPGAHRREVRIPKRLQRRHTCAQDICLNLLSTPYTRWINYIVSITAIDGERIAVSHALTPNDYLQPAETIPFRIENALEALTEPGEWCADTVRGRIVYWPGADEDPERSHFAIPCLSCLIGLQGAEDAPVRDVHIQGLRMARTSAGGAAVELAGTVACSVTGCTVQDVEGHAVKAMGLTHGLRVAGCRIERCGAGGIGLHAPRCTGRVISGHNVIEHNDISRCGQVHWHAAGIDVGGSSHNVLRENHLHELPYAAIQIGGVRLIFAMTGTERNWPPEAVPLDRIRAQALNIETFKRYVCGHNTVEKNRIEDVMRQLDDGGAIYCHASHHNVVRGNVIQRTHRARSHGLYFDDDEIHSVMEENTVIDAPRIPGQGSSIHVHDNACNTVRGNIVLRSHCPFTFPSSYGGHRVCGNMFVMNAGASMPVPPERNQGRYAETRWDAGENVVDDNLYWSEDEGITAGPILQALRERGYDLNSRVGSQSRSLDASE